MLRSGSELIAYYLSDDRRPADRAWSRKHADTQRCLCVRYLEPVIGHLACQDIRVADMQEVVNAAPTAKEGKRVRAMISALVGVGVSGGYLTNDRLKGVHWQAQGRPAPTPDQTARGGRQTPSHLTGRRGCASALGVAFGAWHLHLVELRGDRRCQFRQDLLLHLNSPELADAQAAAANVGNARR
jgi:hypothetical protein